MITQENYMKHVDVAVIGAGYWGPNLLRNFMKIPRAKVIAVCDLDQNRLAAIHKTYPSIAITTNFSEILNNPEISLVVLATPLATHFPLAKKALLSSKHVMIEKPMTQTVAQAKSLIALAEKQKRLLFAGHTFVYNPAVTYIKKLLTRNGLGKIYYYESTRANLGIIQRDTNVIWDLAPHDFSILRSLFKQKPLSIRALGSRHIHTSQEEVAHVFLRFEQNMTAHIFLSWLSPIKVRTVMLAGSKKMLLYDNQEPVDKIRIYNKSVSLTTSKNTAFLSQYRYGDIHIPQIDETEALLTELTHFVSCILQNKIPKTGGQEGLEVVKMLTAAEKSLRTGKEISLTL